MELNILSIFLPATAIALVFYGVVFGNILFDKTMAAKSFIHVALLANIVVLAVIFVGFKRVPMGGFLEIGSETALILGAIYGLLIPFDLKKLSLGLVGGCIVCLIVSLFGGMLPAPTLFTYVSWWQQFSVQAHILAGGLLLFSLICYGTLIFGKNSPNVDPNEITGFARTGLIAAVLVFVLGILASQMWNFTVTGELLLWDKRMLMKYVLTCLLLLPLVSQMTWFKAARNKYLFNSIAIALVFLINLYEWGGLA